MDQFVEFFYNHLALFGALALILSLLAANEVHGNLTGGKRLGALEAVRMINDREPIILDLRPAADFKRGHLLNAINVPVMKLDERLHEFAKDKTKTLIVYDALSSSHSAVEKLRKQGHAEVYPLRGGINAWMSANLPVTTK